MAFHFSPKVVTNGLVLALDAANPKSYVSGSTVWNDLTANNNNGSLTNGPTFSSANGGSIVFDGVDDYAEVTNRNTNLEFQPTQPYSIFSWFKGPPAQASSLMSNMKNTSPYPGYDIWFNNIGLAAHLIVAWPSNAMKVNVSYDYNSNLNKWIYFGYTYNGSCPIDSATTLSSINFYLMGVLYETGKAVDSGADGFFTNSETIVYDTSQRCRVASRWISGAASSPAPVTVSNVSVYNRVLSATEIAQNYNASKTRFGLQ